MLLEAAYHSLWDMGGGQVVLIICSLLRAGQPELLVLYH